MVYRVSDRACIHRGKNLYEKFNGGGSSLISYSIV
jgi:hypothetical protein